MKILGDLRTKKQEKRVDVMSIGLLILLNALACFLFYRFVLCNDNEEKIVESKREYSHELSERIDKLYWLNEQIKSVQELITDIELSGEENLKNFTLEWQTALGKNLSADMLIDGQSEVTKQMRKLAGERLEELTTSLFDEIEKL